ncbi:MAG: PIG-L family deacetylase [Saprospiraceae bacterium]|nr:PIG-L family deacetylase [Saprospiraceae bacterium]
MGLIYKNLLIGISFCLLINPANAFGQQPEKWTSTQIYEAIQQLNFLGSVLYVAAHPDDENTRLISYLANKKKANVVSLSLTRGDGGQNLIGLEMGSALGVLRTQELLAARSVDGGKQFFSRANDFGFSKHPDETLEIWGKDAILQDVVWAIRKWQPDVIINRFWHEYDPALAGRMHGHHTASAALSKEAFDLAARTDVFPEQLQYTQPWQPSRLFFNMYSFFAPIGEEELARVRETGLAKMDVGVYFPLKGKSNNEIAAESRSMHKCQAFGSVGTRGSETEYLQLLKGNRLSDETADIFEGINTTWTRVEGGAAIGKQVSDLIRDFDFVRPETSMAALLGIYQNIAALPQGFWRDMKLEETRRVIKACLALYTEAIAADYTATPGEQVAVSVELTNRAEVPVALKGISFFPEGRDTLLGVQLPNNKPFKGKFALQIPADMPFSNPYWLSNPGSLGQYQVDDAALIGLPETPALFRLVYHLEVAGIPLELEDKVAFKKRDPVDGEVFRPFEITPPVFVEVQDPVYVFTTASPQKIDLVVQSGKANVKGQLRLALPAGWRSEPEQIAVDIALKGAEMRFSFMLFPPEQASEGFVKPEVVVDGQTYSRSLQLIAYDHFPVQTLLKDASAKVLKIDLDIAGKKLGYIMGAGDEIPVALRQMGYEVQLIDPESMGQTDLSGFDAIVVGIRAYNTIEALKFQQPRLMDYVREGGTLVVQYNTSSGLVVPDDQIGPYPFKLGRDRVTKEEAEVRFLVPDHPVLNFPNKITAKDFEGWVQERGLYFVSQWDERYTALLSANDPGEDPRNGGLLVAEHGKGHFVYTGFSWFRELPAGVSGAFRIFANLVSLGNSAKP